MAFNVKQSLRPFCFLNRKFKIDNFDMMLLHNCVVLPLVGSIHKPLGNMGEQTVNSFACGCVQQPIVATLKDT